MRHVSKVYDLEMGGEHLQCPTFAARISAEMENIFNLEYECHPDPWFVDCALLVNQSVADWGTTSPTVVYWDS